MPDTSTDRSPPRRAARVEVRLLGPVEVLVDEVPVPLRRGRQELLVAALALEPGRAVTVGRLVEELWPGEPPDDPANAVQHLVAQVRRALGPARDRLKTVAAGYRLNLAASDSDLGRVGVAMEAARSLLARRRPGEAAEALSPVLDVWRGRPLSGVVDGPLAAEAVRLDGLRADVEVLAADAALAGDTAHEVERTCARLARVCADHPLHEALWQRRITALARVGRTADALTVYQTLRRRLADELGVDPGAALQALHVRLLRQNPPPSTTPGPGPAASVGPPRPAAALPALPATMLFGRTEELGLLTRWRSEGVRLVTVTGAAGVGKTRLAMEYVHQVDRPVTLVQLDTVDADSDVAAAVAAALMMREAGTRNLPDVLAETLPPDGLLLLDNAEHVLGRVADLVTALLGRRSDLAVLVTSQWPLGVPGEHLLRLEVLPTDGVPDVAAPSTAAALLLDRAAQVRPQLATPSAQDRAAAGEVAALLDGLPLAIELAAAQARHLTLPQLAEALRGSLDLLNRQTLRHRPRHRRLVDAVDWSVALLTPPQREVFIRCGALAGTFDAELAATVTDRPPANCLRVLLDLADRSVVHVVAPTPSAPQARFCLLRPLRAYAARRLDQAGDADLVRDRLLGWVVALAEDGDHGIRGPQQCAWLTRLDAARADVENALAYALRVGKVAQAARVVAALGRYWDWRGRLRDAERWTDAVIAAGADAAAMPRYGAVLGWRAFVEIERGETGAGARHARDALDHARTAGDPDGQLTALASLSLAIDTDRGPHVALAVVEDAVGLAVALRDEWAHAWALNRRGHLWLLAGDLDRAAADAHASLERFTTLGDDRAGHWARGLAARIAFARGEQEEARRLAATVLAASRDLGDLRTAQHSAHLLAEAAEDPDTRAALRTLSEGLLAARIAVDGSKRREHVTR